MLNNLMNKVMGSSLTKNYEVEKEPYMHGGLHNLWKVYRAKKKDRNNMDCSLFIFEKKTLDKKKLSQVQRDEICNILKKDPQNLTKLRHPNLLSLVEQPQEDQKFIVFATEPIEYNLSSLVFDATKKELIPGDLEIKCLCLELLEALNFLHNTAKNMHMGLAPENIYITKDGKLKIGGLNFAQQFSTSDALQVPLSFDLKINELSAVPNMRFAAPELSDKQLCSFNTDLFSVGCLIYFMAALNKGKDPFLLNQKDITEKSSHQFEVKSLEKKFSSLMSGFDSDFEMLLKQLCNINQPESRGPLNEVVNRTWFQDPLLKTIKYLESLDSKDHQNKVQFLTGITLILQKFDKKALLKKVVPLLLDQMKVIQLSVNVLPSLIDIMERPNYLTTTEFREYIWPSLQKLCKAKELPAQSLYQILKNTELFMKFVGPQEFQQNFLILINKSLECGVPKLQFLALTKVPTMIKQIDYQVVKQQIVPRVLMLLEKPSQIQLKQKTLEVLNDIISSIDAQTMKDKILKTFEKVRATETDPQVCMLMLKIYEQMAKVLGVEEIGLKILPGIIPMLISGTFTRLQFTEMIQSVRRLLDQIEKHREKDLREMGQETASQDKLEVDDKGGKLASIQNPTNKDVFDFLGSLDAGFNQNKPQSTIQSQTPSGTGQSIQNNLMAGFTGLNLGAASTSNGVNQISTGLSGSDPFAEIMGGQSQAGFNNQNQQKQSIGGGWDSDIPIILDNKPSAAQISNSDNFFNNISSQPQKSQQDNSWGNFGGSTTNQIQNQGNKSAFNTGLGQLNNFGQANTSGNNLNFGGSTFSTSTFGSKNDDPFADLIENQNIQTGLGGNSFGQQNQLNLKNQTNPLSTQSFGTFGTQPQMQSNSLNTNLGMQFQQTNGTNNFGSFSNQQSQNISSVNAGFGTQNFGGQQPYGQQQNNNPLTGLNFGAGFQQQPQNLINNFNPSFTGVGSIGVGQPNNLQNKNGNLNGLNDDFFSQFTSSGTNNQQKQNNFGF